MGERERGGCYFQPSPPPPPLHHHHVGDHRLQLPAPWHYHGNLCVCLQPWDCPAGSQPPPPHPSTGTRWPPRAQEETLQRRPGTHLHCGQAVLATGGGGDPAEPRRESQRYVLLYPDALICCFNCCFAVYCSVVCAGTTTSHSLSQITTSSPLFGVTSHHVLPY